MSRPVELLVIVLGALLLLAGLLALVPAAHVGALFAAACGLTVAGWTAILATTRGRRRPVLPVLLVTWLALLGTWAWLRFGRPEAVGPTTEIEVADFDRAASRAALAELVGRAQASLARVEPIEGYTCVLTKEVRAKGVLGRVRLIRNRLFQKTRHRPFSVYVRFLEPEEKAGSEAIYVEGRNDGKLVAHSTRPLLELLGTMRIDPDDWKARIDQRRPITQAGMRNGLIEFLQLLEGDRAHVKRCEVRVLTDLRIDSRPCTTFQIVNHEPHGGYAVALARLAIDDAMNVPVLFERWEFADVDGERRRRLLERYVFTDVDLDVTLSELDFDPDNPAYAFK
jgi:hypothetical protein